MKVLKRYTANFCIILIALLAAACATSQPFNTQGVNLKLKPGNAVDEVGQKVIWGGTIIEIKNLADKTRLEVLSFPLGSQFRPDASATAQGRFIVDNPGYLEAREYAPGKLITVSGVLQAPQIGKIGDAVYRYPVVKSTSIRLWKEQARSSVRFGIGIGIRN